MGLRSLSCLLLLLLLVPASRQQCTNDDPCLNQPDCTGCADGDKVPNPENCHGYYFCDGGSPVLNLLMECDPGYVFDATLHECIWGADCVICHVEPPTGNCKYECLTGVTDIASFTDCDVYYTCSPSASVTCEDPTPFFDGVECQTDEKLCCHCKPYCEDALTPPYQVADPLDCHKFYVCLKDDKGQVPEQRGSCPEGENFDAFLGACSASASCATSVSCINVVGPDGCIDPFTCVTSGYFARCPNQCTPYYYHCTAATGTLQDAESCIDGLVYHPDTHTCVTEDNCPY